MVRSPSKAIIKLSQLNRKLRQMAVIVAISTIKTSNWSSGLLL